MGTPHYHQCTGDCPDGLSAGAVARFGDEGLAGDQAVALEYFHRRLAHLNNIIESGRTSRHSGVRAAAAELVHERDHLAVLLDAYGYAAAAMADVLTPDGVHRYWSTHCRHGNHDACSATEITGKATTLRGVRGKRVTLERPASIERKSAQCKTCASPCICPCHTGALGVEVNEINDKEERRG